MNPEIPNGEGVESPPSEKESQALQGLTVVDELRQRGNFLQAQKLLDANPVVRAMFEARQSALAANVNREQRAEQTLPRQSPESPESLEKKLRNVVDYWNKIDWRNRLKIDWENEFKNFVRLQGRGWTAETEIHATDTLLRITTPDKKELLFLFTRLGIMAKFVPKKFFRVSTDDDMNTSSLICPAEITIKDKETALNDQLDRLREDRHCTIEELFDVVKKGEVK